MIRNDKMFGKELIYATKELLEVHADLLKCWRGTSMLICPNAEGVHDQRKFWEPLV